MIISIITIIIIGIMIINHDDDLFDSLHGESKSRDGGVSSNRGSASVSSSNTKDNTSTVLLGNLAIMMMMAMMSVTRITLTMMMMTNLNGGDLPTHWNHFNFFTVQCRHLVFGFWLHFCLDVKFSFSCCDDNHDGEDDDNHDDNDDEDDDKDEDNGGKDDYG